jgi:high-affinity iron transporter
VTTGLSKSSTGLVPILDAMEARLKPYVNAGDYRPFDATIIVLREGLEALLVVVALLSFVKQSGNSDKSGFVWGGAVFGLVASIALGLVIHFTLGKAFSGEHRELMEGISGLFAAAMLLYVSYWLHSKSSLGAWHKYISERTTRALATGSLVGLGLLSFLAVFREGGETVLFLIGMTGRISTGDLTLGLAYGFVALAIVGVLLTVAGVKLPMRPFFAVASLLTFYLCFKFIGTGIHALQVADVVSATTSESLPSNDTLGLYPTWQTTIPQIVLLIAGISVAVWGRISDLSLARRTQAAADS